MHRCIPTISACCILLAVTRQGSAESFTFDVTTTSRTEYPVWMPERPLAAPKPQAELSFPVILGSEDNDLALTVVFKEETGSYLSVYWEREDRTRQLLAPNLFENTGLTSQRTLLISRPTMGGPGKVILKSSQAVLNVLKVRLDWARPGVVRLVDSIPNGALVTTGGKIYAPEEVDGSQLTPIADSWEGRILTTSVTDRPERIEKGIDFQVSIPARVIRARIEVLVNGLLINQSLKLWLNNQPAGVLTLEIPDLTDPGYEKVTDSSVRFAGWRKGVLYLTGPMLPVGENQFQFEPPPGAEVAIRDFLLQVDYASNPTTTNR